MTRDEWFGYIQDFLEARIKDAPDESCKTFAENARREAEIRAEIAKWGTQLGYPGHERATYWISTVQFLCDQLDKVRRETVEQCAQIAVGSGSHADRDLEPGYTGGRRDAAAAIRKLALAPAAKEPTP